MAITSGDTTDTVSKRTAWTLSWAKANAQVMKMKSQADYLSDLQERLYLPQIQQSPTVQLYSKAYRLAAARRHPKRKRLQRNTTKNNALQLPELRQTWSLFEETNASGKDEVEPARPRRNSDPHLPPLSEKQDVKAKKKERPGNKVSVSLVVDYTNKKALGQNYDTSSKKLFESPAYPARKAWKKHANYRRHNTLEPLDKPRKRKDNKDIKGGDSHKADSERRSPLYLQNNKSTADELREEERVKYRLQQSNQNLEDYRKEHDRKVAAGRRMRAPPNSADSKRERRKSKHFSEKRRKKSIQEKIANGKVNDDSGFSSKNTADLKRKPSQQEESASIGQVNLEEVHPEFADGYTVSQLSDAKRLWIRWWLEDCERHRSHWQTAPDDLDGLSQIQESTPKHGEGDTINELKMPFGQSPDNKKTLSKTQKSSAGKVDDNS
ncbi:eukaryotic translation initiation factor 5B-like [Ptychodera flava]|uniref:eukaryotic translation initiation factor 5B-like n=1 Tax=Ptychodera flava TaxID=63121 RepID=UPI00396A53A1